VTCAERTSETKKMEKNKKRMKAVKGGKKVFNLYCEKSEKSPKFNLISAPEILL
jgi:hypothetical protein